LSSVLNKEHRIGSILLCSGKDMSDPVSRDSRIARVPDAVSCLSEAMTGSYDLVAVELEKAEGDAGREILQLCRVLKSNRLTCDKPLLVILYSINRGLIDRLDKDGADYVIHLADNDGLRSLDRLSEAVDRLDNSDIPAALLEKVCPFLHSSSPDVGGEIFSCGAHGDILVLGRQRVNSFCSAPDHRACPFFLAPKSGRFKKADESRDS